MGIFLLYISTKIKKALQKYFKGDKMRRRQFIKKSIYGTAALSGLPLLTNSSFIFAQNLPQAVVVKNGEPAELLAAALKNLGGLKRFITRGDVVVIKPNIGWDRSPALAANTNPELIQALVKACFSAGAKKVRIFDRTCNNPRRCYRNSGIEEKAKAAGAEVLHVRDNHYKNIKIGGKLIDEWPINKNYLQADKVINVPVAKHHSLSRVSLGMKNLMGVMGGNRGSLHNHFAEKISEIDTKILPALTIIDAYRILTEKGPQGGRPEYVKLTKTLIASPCMVSADFLALELFGLQLQDVEHLRVAAEKGLNKYDLKRLKVKRIDLA